MTYSFHPAARAEFEQAVLYYFEKSPSLAAIFYAEVECGIEGIVKNPLLYRKIDEDVRRCLTKRFPYGILYTIEDHYILILAVMHCSREPFYWKNRRAEK
ncbi:MAG: plasmid stabilization protein [Deltaproteobacteria bacterium CG17_big_fil_post_rev_8_21_14_2_50_51_6]|nr:MAG: plasmid stabilization protein [Deltaproteobacteria bacterium CG17_big_fil_post_rev_8_21_14_2_50_51_6]